MVDKALWTNDYCIINEDKKPSKYCAINPTSRRDTIEIRVHQGSVDMNSVLKWISLLVNIVDSKGKVPEFKSKADVMKWKNLKRPLKQYVSSTYNVGFLEAREKEKQRQERALAQRIENYISAGYDVNERGQVVYYPTYEETVGGRQGRVIPGGRRTA
jgi:hypothetical protein